jgi:ABC-type multidrug transport system ATPase subunit
MLVFFVFNANIDSRYMNAVIKILGIAYILGIIGVVYHLVGRMASERELGMSQLIEAMVPNRHRWQTQAIRLLSLHLAMDIIWLPGWVVTGFILKALVYTKTSYGIVVIWQLLSGFALSSWSILGASFFSRAQLSGISVIIVSLILAIVVQVQTPDSTGAIAILGFLFTPMNYIFNVIYLARFERNAVAADLLKDAPPRVGSSEWKLPGIVLWVFLIIQIIVYPLLGAIIERSKYGTTSKERKVLFGKSEGSTSAITLRGFSKSYIPRWWSRKISPLFGGDGNTVVQAVKSLNLEVLRGQILCLLGANGSGKSTTLDAIAGLTTITDGEIIVDGTGGIGYCPQKNVLWDELTVFEHVAIFNELKSIGKPHAKEAVVDLIRACDLEHKMHAQAKTLSGGQKRKLQLAMMFTGGSHVCCIDEVSSGLDPLSRRKIWEILLKERQSRSLLLTTHFLDEADVLSDFIVLMSKGHLKAEGSAAELKHKFGGNYRVQVKRPEDSDEQDLTNEKGNGIVVSSRQLKAVRSATNSYTFECIDSAEAAKFLQEIEKEGIHDYTVHGPSIEDVFLELCEEAHEEQPSQVSLWKEPSKEEEEEEEDGAVEPAPISYVRPKRDIRGLSTPESSDSGSSPSAAQMKRSRSADGNWNHIACADMDTVQEAAHDSSAELHPLRHCCRSTGRCCRLGDTLPRRLPWTALLPY